MRDPKTKRKQRKWLAFVLVSLDWTPQQVYRKYRRRFGIEASYRLLRQVKVLTNSRNPALRFFFLGLGLLMQNVWVLARWLFTRRPGKGRHKLIPEILRLTASVSYLCAPSSASIHLRWRWLSSFHPNP
ncbi:MAG: transposase [Chloroflexi bacterium]|nr:transposase [Chloroflexota bacterium]